MTGRDTAAAAAAAAAEAEAWEEAEVWVAVEEAAEAAEEAEAAMEAEAGPPPPPDRGMLFDAGEGVVGSLRRRFGAEAEARTLQLELRTNALDTP